MLAEKMISIMREKNSRLCVGLDPVSIFMRDKDTVPKEYFGAVSETQAFKQFCLDVIEECGPYAAAFKPNTQFLFGFSQKDFEELNKAIHAQGCVSILDHKLSDIGSTNESLLYWMGKANFDSLTASPFPGNIEEVCTQAHRKEKGVFMLTLMSNPEAPLFMRATLNGMPAYKAIAMLAKDHADGFVVGADNTLELREVREIVGENKIILVPGVGRQGNNGKEVIAAAGQNTLVNVGRDILYHEDRELSAKKYRDMLQ